MTHKEEMQEFMIRQWSELVLEKSFRSHWLRGFCQYHLPVNAEKFCELLTKIKELEAKELEITEFLKTFQENEIR